MIKDAQLATWFSDLYIVGDDQMAYDAIRTAGRQLATIIRNKTPEGADQDAAIRKVREAVMTVHAAIACGGK